MLHMSYSLRHRVNKLAHKHDGQRMQCMQPVTLMLDVVWHTFWQKVARAVLLSSLALNARPRVQAKMLATGLVLVGLPFWYCRQCRVTVPAC